MKNTLNKLSFTLVVVALVFGLSACEKAETNITEKASISAEDEHNHQVSEGNASGRLLVANPESSVLQVFNIAKKSLLTTITPDAMPGNIYAAGGSRFAALVERDAGKVSFVDGGLYEEPHDDHFDLVTMVPSMTNYVLSASHPTHFVTHEGDVAIFLDGNQDSAINAGVLVFDDHTIEEGEAPASVEFMMAQHGVAEPRGEYLITSLRREDELSTSAVERKILPDQVAVYHLHDGDYEWEETFNVSCPDLHGAAQNENYIVFGCSDGVLVVTDGGNGSFSAQKLLNSSDVAEGLRIGSIWGHHESEQFIGQASSRSSDTVQFFAINPAENEMELINWQPEAGAKPVVRNFTYEAEQFVILDDQGYLTLIEPHQENGHIHWEYDGARLDISEGELTDMPEGMKFSMALSKNSNHVFITDPIMQHILIVDIDPLQEAGEIELDFSPAMPAWLGIAERHEH